MRERERKKTKKKRFQPTEIWCSLIWWFQVEKKKFHSLSPKNKTEREKTIDHNFIEIWEKNMWFLKKKQNAWKIIFWVEKKIDKICHFGIIWERKDRNCYVICCMHDLPTRFFFDIWKFWSSFFVKPTSSSLTFSQYKFKVIKAEEILINNNNKYEYIYK